MGGGRSLAVAQSGCGCVLGERREDSHWLGPVRLSSAQLNSVDNSSGDRDFPCVSESVCVSVCMCVGVCRDIGRREKRVKNSPVQGESEKNETFMVRAVSHSSSPVFCWPGCY